MTQDSLSFYSGSLNRLPGEGVNEQVSYPDEYKQLSRILNWRKMLSNFWIAPFQINGKTYRTVEHYFQSEKLRLVDTELADTFTVESGTPLGTEGTGLDARQMRKAKLLTKEQLEVWDSIKDNVMERAWRAKFLQNEPLQRVLLATNSAELWHRCPRMQPEHFVGLESLRNLLRLTA
jgi:ribA/ribD-fused uncharacterized protein